MNRRSFHFELMLAVAALFACTILIAAKNENASNNVSTLLTDNIEAFSAIGPADDRISDVGLKKIISDQQINVATAARHYRNQAGAAFSIEITQTENDSAAYALLTQLASNQQTIARDKVGIANIDYSNGIVFYKGNALVRIEAMGTTPLDRQEILRISRAFAATLPAADDDIPALVKHLPSGPTNTHASYVVSLNGLKSITANQPIIDVVSFEGGTEAVAANYGQAQVVIVEFTTPQLSIDNDSRIWTKLAELKNKGEPIPTAYRRVGNYSVFVFNAPDDKTANALIDQVKYEQVVQWLGEDPHLYERLQKYLTQKSAGVLVAVLKSSGLSLLLCLAAGALIGTMMFRHRRAQKAAMYSDAGGSIRLNLDELTAPTETRPLLEPANHNETGSRTS